MKKTVIVCTQPIKDINISAFVRIIKSLEVNVPNVEIISDNFERYNGHIDNIVIAYGTFYADFQNMMRFLNKYSDKRFYYLVNEYDLRPNGDIYKFIIKHNYELIANYEEDSLGAKHYTKYHMLNLNLTALKDLEYLDFNNRTRRLIYWGTYRPDRNLYFKRYFSDITLSTSEKSIIKFQDLLSSNDFKSVSIIDKIDFNSHSILNHYKFTLYIEDNYTHTHYNHLADRFYESLSFGLIMFFDISTKHNVRLSGYNIDDFYFVSSREELETKMNAVESQPDAHLAYFKRLKAQALAEQAKLYSQVTKIFNSPIQKYHLTCPTCQKLSLKDFKCSNCSNVICSNCLEIKQKHYCPTCFDKLGLKKEDLQTILF